MPLCLRFLSSLTTSLQIHLDKAIQPFLYRQDRNLCVSSLLAIVPPGPGLLAALSTNHSQVQGFLGTSRKLPRKFISTCAWHRAGAPVPRGYLRFDISSLQDSNLTFKTHLLNLSSSLDIIFPVLLSDLFVVVPTVVLTKIPLLQHPGTQYTTSHCHSVRLHLLSLRGPESTILREMWGIPLTIGPVTVTDAVLPSKACWCEGGPRVVLPPWAALSFVVIHLNCLCTSYCAQMRRSQPCHARTVLVSLQMFTLARPSSSPAYQELTP